MNSVSELDGNPVKKSDLLEQLDRNNTTGLRYFRAHAEDITQACKAGYSLRAIYDQLKALHDVPFGYSMFCRYCRTYGISSKALHEVAQAQNTHPPRRQPFYLDPD
jgi:hypothetical protein